MDKIILIGGSPTTGKSYIARKLAESLKLPWISTDTVREQMRKLVDKKDYPKLFVHANANGKTALRYLSENSAQTIVQNEVNESIEVWQGVKALIETDYVWGSFIIEGVAVLPSLVKKLSIKNKNIRAVFLIDENIDRVRKTVFTRGLWDNANTYPDSIKEKEVAWVLAFNQYLIKEAKKYNLPVIRITDRKKLINQINKLIK